MMRGDGSTPGKIRESGSMAKAIEKSLKDTERYAALWDIAEAWRNIQRHLRDTDTDWNRRRHVGISRIALYRQWGIASL
jgi:hypothetical protein